MTPAFFASVVAAAIVMLAITFASIAWLGMEASRRRRLQRRLMHQEDQPTDFAETGANPVLQGMATQGKAIERALDSEGASDRLMIRAGWRSATSRLVFYTLWFISPFVTLSGVAALGLFGPDRLRTTPILLLVGAAATIVGLLLPSLVRSRVAAKRQARIGGEVPLFIHVLVLLFESGLSTRQAFASMVREGKGVLSELGEEIELLLRQVEAGGEMSEALTRLSEAIDVPDLTTVLALLRQVEPYGGEVKEPLLDTLEVIEDRREMDLREKVNLISGRMTVVMVLFFFPALIIFVAGPAWVSLMATLGGVAK